MKWDFAVLAWDFLYYSIKQWSKPVINAPIERCFSIEFSSKNLWMQKNKVGSLENFGINMGFLAIDIKTYPNSFKKFYNIFFCIYNPLSFTQFFFWSGVGEVGWGWGKWSGVFIFHIRYSASDVHVQVFPKLCNIIHILVTWSSTFSFIYDKMLWNMARYWSLNGALAQHSIHQNLSCFLDQAHNSEHSIHVIYVN